MESILRTFAVTTIINDTVKNPVRRLLDALDDFFCVVVLLQTFSTCVRAACKALSMLSFGDMVSTRLGCDRPGELGHKSGIDKVSTTAAYSELEPVVPCPDVA